MSASLSAQNALSQPALWGSGMASLSHPAAVQVLTAGYNRPWTAVLATLEPNDMLDVLPSPCYGYLVQRANYRLMFIPANAVVLPPPLQRLAPERVGHSNYPGSATPHLSPLAHSLIRNGAFARCHGRYVYALRYALYVSGSRG